MKERPILFSGPMVRAILEGRKTMTRRVVKNSINELHLRGNPVQILANWGLSRLISFSNGMAEFNVQCDVDDYFTEKTKCPYGILGDRLWGRETFFICQDGPIYRADFIGDHTKIAPNGGTFIESVKWKPSIFMPRSASRILLEITNVRVERLQDITEEDAIAEGVEPVEWGEDMGGMPGDFTSYVEGFKDVWQSINGPDSWEQNPWVWVIEFKKIVP